jgi:hypothetical protein
MIFTIGAIDAFDAEALGSSVTLVTRARDVVGRVIWSHWANFSTSYATTMFRFE